MYIIEKKMKHSIYNPYFFALSDTMQLFWHMGKQAVAKPTPWVPVLKSLPQMKVIWVIEFSKLQN